MGDKSFDLTIKRKSGVYNIRLFIDADNTHPYSADAKGRAVQIAPDRVFSLERARLLDWILPTVKNPSALLADRGNKLYISRRLPSDLFLGYQMVVLQPEKKGEFSLSSAYPLTPVEFQDKRRQLRPTTPSDKGAGCVKQSGPIPYFSRRWRNQLNSGRLRIPRCQPHGKATHWEWEIQRADGEHVVYGVSRFTHADQRAHVVTVYVAQDDRRRNLSPLKKSGPALLPTVLSRRGKDTAAESYYRPQRGQDHLNSIAPLVLLFNATARALPYPSWFTLLLLFNGPDARDAAATQDFFANAGRWDNGRVDMRIGVGFGAGCDLAVLRKHNRPTHPGKARITAYPHATYQCSCPRKAPRSDRHNPAIRRGWRPSRARSFLHC